MNNLPLIDVEFRKTGDGVTSIKSWLVELKFKGGDTMPIFFNANMGVYNIIVTCTEIIKELMQRFA